MTMSNLLICWLCDNVNLKLIWILRVLGTRRQCMTVFSKKKLNKISEKVDFLQIRHFLTAEMGKASSERCTKQGTYCTNKTLSCSR